MSDTFTSNEDDLDDMAEELVCRMIEASEDGECVHCVAEATLRASLSFLIGELGANQGVGLFATIANGVMREVCDPITVH